MQNVVKLSDLKSDLVCVEGNEERYNCPFCLEIRGKSDLEAKLYYNPKRRIGHCWKCQTIVIGNDDWSLETASNKLRSKEDSKVQIYDLSGWSFPVVENSPSYSYLLGRGLSSEVIKKYQFRESDFFEGVVIPNPSTSPEDRFVTNFCQIRYFNNKTSSLRYLGIPGSKKPVYASNLVERNSKLIVCEGVFSCISASTRLGLPAIALYGKSLSKYQEEVIKKLEPYKIILILDGKELRDIIEIGKRFSFMFPTSAVFLSYGKDPEEEVNLKECFNTYFMELNHLTLKKLNLIRYSYLSSEKKWENVRSLCLKGIL